jgi:hypothetical protein
LIDYPHCERRCDGHSVIRLRVLDSRRQGLFKQEVPSRFALAIVWRGLRLDEDIGSSGEVNRFVGELLGESLPSVDLRMVI